MLFHKQVQLFLTLMVTLSNILFQIPRPSPVMVWDVDSYASPYYERGKWGFVTRAKSVVTISGVGDIPSFKAAD